MPYKYIGRTTDFCGKTLWEIVGNLKNFGAGRLVTRSRFERYPEKSYFKIVKVEALDNPKDVSIDNMRKVRVLAERTFRGVKMPKLVNIEAASYKTDYRLIPKEDEHLYLSATIEKEEHLLPKYGECPPLLREYLLQTQQKEDVKLEMVYSKYKKVAPDGVLDINELDTKYAPELYKDIQSN